MSADAAGRSARATNELVASGYQFLYFVPVYFPDIQAIAYPAARADIGWQIETCGIGFDQPRVIAR